MNIVEITGGLGNQMFQYALIESFREKNIPVECDTTYYRSDQKLRAFTISSFPHVSINLADDKAVENLRGYGYNDSIAKKIWHKINTGKIRIFKEDLDKGYQSEVFDVKNSLICGYWQNEKYFASIRNKIIFDYEFPSNIINSKNTDYLVFLNKILKSNSVSLHIRRKDYLNKSNIAVYGNICNDKYYYDAIQTIRSNIENPIFMVFTDDPEWVRSNQIFRDMIIVSGEYKGNDLMDLYLMTKCNNHIIANSSFSWWGAWLSNEKKGLVIAPSRWFNNHEQTDMIPKRWTKL